MGRRKSEGNKGKREEEKNERERGVIGKRNGTAEKGKSGIRKREGMRKCTDDRDKE